MSDSFHNKWQYISELLNGKELRDEDLGEMSDDELKDILKHHFRINQAFRMMSKDDFDEIKAWNSINNNFSGNFSKRRFSLLSKIAAVIILFITVGYFAFFYFAPSGEEQEIMVAKNHSVELFLPTGEMITLDENFSSIIVDNKTFIVEEDSVDLLDNMYSFEDDIKAFSKLYVPRGANFKITLPDGSQVWINSESELRFPLSFPDDERRVYLSGEAYFEVEKDNERPFYVCSGDETVKVLGTQFNIKAYEEESYWLTTLVSGRVMLNDEVVLMPSCQYILNRLTGQAEVREVDTYMFVSWKSGRYYFQNTNLVEVVRYMQRWYDFEVDFADDKIKEIPLSGSINKDRSFEEMLHILERISDTKVDYNGRKVIFK